MLETFFDQLQTVRLSARETPSTPRVDSRFEVGGLIRRGVKHNGQTMLSEYDDFQLSPQDVTDLKGMLTIPLKELGSRRDAYVATRTLPYGIDSDSMQVRAGARGEAPHIPMEMEMAPYSLPKGQLPIPMYALHWPGILPYAPEVKPKLGESWDNIIEVTPSLPPMAVKATCRVLHADHMYAHIQLTLDQSPVTAMVEKIRLTMKPSGSWIVIMNHETGQFIRSSGQIRAVLDGQGPADVDSTEILNYTSDFRFIQVPLSTSDGNLTTAAWKPFLDNAPNPTIPPPAPPTP
jgi:hypothetical protein